MSANKKILGLVVVIFLSSILTAIPVNARICNPTSLEIWKTIECKHVCGERVTISGWIYIKNDPNYAANIIQIIDKVEAKSKNNPWVELKSYEVSDGMVVPAGATIKVWYSIAFFKGDYKAYRNVVRVHLDNHPTGDKWYTYRLSFKVPND